MKQVILTRTGAHRVNIISVHDRLRNNVDCNTVVKLF